MKAVRGFDLKKITDRKEKEGIYIHAGEWAACTAPLLSLSLILDCLHRVVLALRAYSCLKEKCSLNQLPFIRGQPKPVESRLFDNLSPIHSS